MTKRSAKPAGFDLGTDDTAQGRQSGEAVAIAPRKMHDARRKNRTIQWGVKTTLMKRGQHERLALRTRKNMTEVYEDALDALEEKLNREGKRT
jgi:hypothetical protein